MMQPPGQLLHAVTAVSSGAPAHNIMAKHTFQATVTGTGAVTAVVALDVSNNGINWLLLSTITLSGTGSASDGVALEAPWLYIRARVTGITGTGAAVDCDMNVSR